MFNKKNPNLVKYSIVSLVPWLELKRGPKRKVTSKWTKDVNHQWWGCKLVIYVYFVIVSIINRFKCINVYYLKWLLFCVKAIIEYIRISDFFSPSLVPSGLKTIVRTRSSPLRPSPHWSTIVSGSLITISWEHALGWRIALSVKKISSSHLHLLTKNKNI